MSTIPNLAILGAGNIGTAIARGLLATPSVSREKIILTRRHPDKLAVFQQQGCETTANNEDAVRASDIVIVAVEPQQLNGLLDEIAAVLEPERHLMISVVSGASIADIRQRVGEAMPVVRAMPNTAIGVGQSMTCLAASPDVTESLQTAIQIFEAMGAILIIDEEQMSAATALCACGTAFFLRAIRAASQGGIEIGFHADEALLMAAETARGAAALLAGERHRLHPEHEIDRVTTPRGATISGLNEMEHQGFSSALIRGIVTSARKINRLYGKDD